MNVFFRINDTLLTAPVSERILDGITRKKFNWYGKEGIQVDVRSVISIGTSWSCKNGSLKEIFEQERLQW
jgi:branched-chain amino acid aminotransferase